MTLTEAEPGTETKLLYTDTGLDTDTGTGTHAHRRTDVQTHMHIGTDKTTAL